MHNKGASRDQDLSLALINTLAVQCEGSSLVVDTKSPPILLVASSKYLTYF